jgi:hypothetical protein
VDERVNILETTNDCWSADLAVTRVGKFGPPIGS